VFADFHEFPHERGPHCEKYFILGYEPIYSVKIFLTFLISLLPPC